MTGQLGGYGDVPAYRTSDALAEEVFQSMLTIEARYPGELTSELLTAATGLIRSCVDLLQTGPPQYRAEVQRLLPLTQLELDLIDPAQLEANRNAAEDLAARLGRWITRSPIHVDERPVHVAEFLGRLWPSLGVWEDRMAVDAMIDRATHSNA